MPGTFKLDHLHPFKLLLFWKFFIFFTFILGGQFLLPQRANNGEKGILPTPKVDETEGVQCLGHSNWTICIPLSPFCSGNYSSFSPSYWEANSYYPGGPIMGKGIHPTPKVNETEGFQCLGHSNWTICIPLNPFCSGNFPSFSPSYWGGQFLLPQRTNNGKREFFQPQN